MRQDLIGFQLLCSRAICMNIPVDAIVNRTGAFVQASIRASAKFMVSVL